MNVAYRFFQLPRDPRLEVDVEDGRRYLQKTDEKWDVILLDAYYSDSVPFHLATREFLQLARTHLNPGGLVVANIIGSVEGSGSKLFRSFYRTYRSVFPSVAVHPVGLQGDIQSLRNIIVIAGNSAPRASFSSTAGVNSASATRVGPGAPIRTATRSSCRRATSVLTDDYAPTDALIIVDGHLKNDRARTGRERPVRVRTGSREQEAPSGTSQPKNAFATSYHSGGTVFSSFVASSSETSTIASPCSAAMRPNRRSCARSAALSP